MYETPDKKNLESIIIGKDTVVKNSEPLLIYTNKQSNQKIIGNKS